MRRLVLPLAFLCLTGTTNTLLLARPTGLPGPYGAVTQYRGKDTPVGALAFADAGTGRVLAATETALFEFVSGR